MSNTFQNLVAAPLHNLQREAWDAYLHAMAVYAIDANESIRAQAIERLCMAALSAEPSDHSAAKNYGPVPPYDAAKRARWLIDTLSEAHQRHHDVIPRFLGELRYKGHHPEQMSLIQTWLHSLLAAPPTGVDRESVRGTLLLIDGFDADDARDVARMIAHLDDAASYVRACAARVLSAASGDAINEIALFETVKQKELLRPGVAGPFWSEWHSDASAAPIDPVPWMMEMLERRRGDPPADLPFNDIAFYLHELCDRSPATVRRMIVGGFIDLALETATESRARVAGLEPVLCELAARPESAVRRTAQIHLAAYYDMLHPLAPRDEIDRRVDSHADLSVYCFFWASAEYATHIVAYPSAAKQRVTDGEAWAFLDRVFPEALRGSLTAHFLEFDRSAPPRAFRLGNQLMFRYTSSATISLTGDPDAKLWERIEVHAASAASRWKAYPKRLA